MVARLLMENLSKQEFVLRLNQRIHGSLRKGADCKVLIVKESGCNLLLRRRT